MALVGIIGGVHGINKYLQNEHIELMSLVFVALSVLYFVSLGFKQEQEDDSNR
jgi:uncharacterized membrane protein YfcA